ncbi:MAG: hypothetical protein PHG85_02725 [Candidatus Altiarchaeota archaeon]|nr:hypothetical protein [Candidatus Altiarchaeota archaeon]
MGAFERIFGPRKLTAQESVDMQYLAGIVSTVIGEELKPAKSGSRSGFMTASGVVGVFPGDYFSGDATRLSIVGIGELSHKGELAGLEGGSFINAGLLEKICGLLDNEGLKYGIFASARWEMPVHITTKKGNVVIAPVISTL